MIYFIHSILITMESTSYDDTKRKYHEHKGDVILKVFDCVVTISVDMYLVLWLF
jgi:hypothetical protein